MNGNGGNRLARKIRVILPVILRITLSLVLWTLGAASMCVVEAETREHRVVQEIPVDRDRVEKLQRWVDAGHDSWCRNPQMVAAMTLRQFAPEYSSYDCELASLTTDDGIVSANEAIYTYYSVDGHTTYRVTLKRFDWQSKTAGRLQSRIWIPVRSEKITRVSLD